VKRNSNGGIICVEGDDDDDCRVIRIDTGIPNTNTH
jgi:hypothetical protein